MEVPCSESIMGDDEDPPLHINQLPTSLILQIFKCLNVVDLCLSARPVCKLWAEIGQDSSLWHTINVNSCENLQDNHLDHVIEKYGMYLEKLEIYSCKSLTNITFEKIAQNCLKLRYLDVRNTNISLTDLLTLTESLKSLQELNCSHCEKLPFIETNFALSTLPNLCKYQKPKSTVFNKDSFLAVCSLIQKCKMLEDIQINHCDITDDMLETLTGYCPSLKILNISMCEYLTDDGVSNILSTMTSLTEVILLGSHIGDHGISQIAENCPNLMSIDVTDCQRVTDVGIINLVTNCKSLEKLIINDSPFSSSNITNEALLQIGRSCPNLKTLAVAKSNINNIGVNAVCKGCPRLGKLDVSGCVCLA